MECRRSLRIAAAAGLVGLLATPSLAVSPSEARPSRAVTAPAQRRAAVPELAWTPCGDGLQCSTAAVPLDYDAPGGKKITLALIRRPASDPQHRIGSLFVNNGGPGNSVLDFVRNDAAGVLPSDVQKRFDVVGFDPRGVGQSTPVQCFASTEAQQQFSQSRPPFPVGHKEITAFTASSAEIGRRCQHRNHELLGHLSTANVARDLDLLRRAVGDRKLTFAGYSYGGLLGLTYANLFPGKVRALMLDGAPDPVQWTTGRSAKDRKAPVTVRLDGPAATSGALHFFLDACQRAGDGCAFASHHTAAKFDALLRRLRRAPITADLPPGPFTPGGPFTVTYAQIVDGLRGALTFPPIWGDIASLLEGIDAAPPSAARADAAANAEVAPEEYDNSAEALLAVLCSETENPSNPHRWPRVARRADRKDPYFGADWAFVSQPCATWPARDADRYTGPFNRATANPLLFVHARFDAASSYEQARTTVAATPGARLLTLEGPGHPATFVPNACLNDAVARYLLHKTLPPVGAKCRPDFQPFP